DFAMFRLLPESARRFGRPLIARILPLLTIGLPPHDGRRIFSRPTDDWPSRSQRRPDRDFFLGFARGRRRGFADRVFLLVFAPFRNGLPSLLRRSGLLWRPGLLACLGLLGWPGLLGRSRKRLVQRHWLKNAPDRRRLSPWKVARTHLRRGVAAEELFDEASPH